MGFHVSAGVYVSEIDLTTIVPSVATTEAAFAGLFRWGPVGQRVLIDSETKLVNRFGKPTNHNGETFFSAANFLSYSNKLYVVRAANTTGSNTNVANTVLSAVAYVNSTPANSVMLSSIVRNSDDIANMTWSTDVYYAARCPGALGNSLKISVCDSANAYSANIALSPGGNVSSGTIAINVGSNSALITIVPSSVFADTAVVTDAITAAMTAGDYIKVGNSLIGTSYLKVSSIASVVQDGANAQVTVSLVDPYFLSTAWSSNTIQRYWEYFNAVDKVPGKSDYQLSFGNTSANDELHVVVSDQDGLFTGVPGQVLEIFPNLSRATDARSENGTSTYYKTVLNEQSNYVWAASDRSGAASNTASNLVTSTNAKPQTTSFVLGQDGSDENNESLAVLSAGYNLFLSPEDVDISIIIQGVAKGGTNGTGLANFIINNITEVRKDCVLTASPEKADVVNASGNELTNVIAYRNSLTNSSYAMVDSGYKWQYDRYNDVYRWIPLNGDIAGLIARTDQTTDPWYSPGGYNRGRIKNVVKLAWTPSQADRDQLAKSDINPVVSFVGQGPILFGDKTLLGKPSAFDRINVRRLFIVLEKAIARAAQYTLFEFNDEFTRAQFRNMVEPFLREVQGRRGLHDFRVVCDETNNTAEVIDSNGFVGDIYIKPARSITAIQLNFIASRTGVEFSEIVGRFG